MSYILLEATAYSHHRNQMQHQYGSPNTSPHTGGVDLPCEHLTLLCSCPFTALQVTSGKAHIETQGSTEQGRRRAGQGRAAQRSTGVVRTLRSRLSSCAVVLIMAVAKNYFGNLSSDSDSENELEKLSAAVGDCRNGPQMVDTALPSQEGDTVMWLQVDRYQDM
ncbi:hypothetical protein O3P69_016549 [Scylla paramamosain]|uniref:Uncharacterized protein n=1 Tax=Scylla paramamosain TaxID=85552 RepID=A0AAW0SF33_SCYPA